MGEHSNLEDDRQVSEPGTGLLMKGFQYERTGAQPYSGRGIKPSLGSRNLNDRLRT